MATLQDVAVAVGRLETHHGATTATLARIEASLVPLAARVADLEKWKTRAKLYAVGLAMLLLSNLTGIKGDVVISILAKLLA